MTRACSGSFTAESTGPTSPFSTIPATATGRRRARWSPQARRSRRRAGPVATRAAAMRFGRPSLDACGFARQLHDRSSRLPFNTTTRFPDIFGELGQFPTACVGSSPGTCERFGADVSSVCDSPAPARALSRLCLWKGMAFELPPSYAISQARKKVTSPENPRCSSILSALACSIS